MHCRTVMWGFLKPWVQKSVSEIHFDETDGNLSLFGIKFPYRLTKVS